MNFAFVGNEWGRETIMRYLAQWVVAATISSSALACGGRQMNDVGDLNSEQGGNGGDGGTPEGGTGPGGKSPTGGVGGSTPATGGVGGPMPSTGGSGAHSGQGGGGGSGGSCAIENGCLYQEGNDVRALAADETNLYWVEYGTHDELGNFNNDGRLLARAFGSEEVRTLAEGLEGPIRVDLTTTYAYVFVDQYWDGGVVRARFRVPLDGGDREFVAYGLERNDGTWLARCMHCLVHSEERVYWPEIEGIWWATETNAEGQSFVSFPGQLVSDLAVSGDQLLFVVHPDTDFRPLELYTVPLDGGNATRFSGDAMQPFTISGDFFYGVDWPLRETANGAPYYYISLSPVTGGPWTRLVEHEGWPRARMEIVGDLVFHERLVGPNRLDASRVEVLQGTLEDPQAEGAVIGFDDGAANDYPYDWIGTTHGIFWTTGDGIYLRHN